LVGNRLIWLLRLTAAAVILLVCGCYLPSEFDAQLQIDRSGNYIFRYNGSLTHLGLLKELNLGTLNAGEVAKKILNIQRDLARDSGYGPGSSLGKRVRHIKHMKNSTFRVAYKRTGNLKEERSFNFVRFNSRMLSISLVPDKSNIRKGSLIKIIGDKPNNELIKALERSNLKANGRFRIQTDAVVLRHNADSSYQTGKSVVYVWEIKSLTRTPPALIFKPEIE
tara:strand:- start:185 stop:853 length:669 start_codon:yes stop_codon:yes gene_type:complete